MIDLGQRPERRFLRTAIEMKPLRPDLDSWIGNRLDWMASVDIVPIRRGRVDRKHVYEARRLDYRAARNLKIGEDHFRRHDRMLAAAGVTEKAHDGLHLRMSAFLEEHFSAGTLVFGPEGVNRKWLVAELGVHTPVFVRYPETKKVVDGFDDRIRDQVPTSGAHPRLAADLESLLAGMRRTGTCPVFKDRLNVTEVARLLRITPSAFELVPECAKMLAAENRRIRHEDPVRPYHDAHGRNYSFHDLVSPYGTVGAAKLAARFIAGIDSVSGATAKSTYALTLEILIHVAETLPGRLVAELAADRPVDGKLVEKALLSWRSKVLKGKAQPRGLSDRIVNGRAALDKLQLLGDATDVLVGLQNAGASRPKSSLAEAPVRCRERIADMVQSFAATKELDYDPKEVDAFLANLAISRELAGISVDQLPEAIRKLNRERLDAIERPARRRAFARWKHQRRQRDREPFERRTDVALRP